MTSRDYLFSLEQHGIKLGLENISHILRAAGNPQCDYPSVHIAGTNGKGSVTAMLDRMLCAAGYSTGRFTSPHLIRLNERFLLNGCPISDAELDDHLDAIRSIAEPMDPPPTFFEVVTAVAFRCFSQRRIGAGVIEVGLGGRFDSTNVIVPQACAITNIDFEHTQYLGDTLAKIAFEKAGIIKPGVPVVVSETKPEAREVILERARALASPVSLVDRDFSFQVVGTPFALDFSYESARLRLGPVRLGLAGTYQAENAATAVAAAELLQTVFPNLSGTAIAEGLNQAHWPCRLERVLDHPPVIIDVAHNSAGARKLVRELTESVIVLAVSGDKDIRTMAEALAPVARELLITEFTGPRAMPIAQVARALTGLRFRTAPNLRSAIQIGMELASETLPLVITGSIFTAGEARNILINDYGASPLIF